MGEMLESDVRTLVSGALVHVFESMISVRPEVSEQPAGWSLPGDRIAGSVSFAGKASGIVSIHLTYDFAERLATHILGFGPEDGLGEEEIRDVVGELSNMVGGNFKSRLCDKGFTCELTIPSITLGKSFRIAGLKGTIRYGYAAKIEDDQLVVEIFFKNAG